MTSTPSAYGQWASGSRYTHALIGVWRSNRGQRGWEKGVRKEEGELAEDANHSYWVQQNSDINCQTYKSLVYALIKVKYINLCTIYLRCLLYLYIIFELTLTEHFVVLDLSSCSSRRVQLKQAGVLLSLFASFGPFWAIGTPFLWSAEFGPRPVVPILQPLCLSLFLMTHSLGSLPALLPPQWLPGETDGWAPFMKLLQPTRINQDRVTELLLGIRYSICFKLLEVSKYIFTCFMCRQDNIKD